MSRLSPTMTYRDLVRAYVGRGASNAECDYAWFFIAGYPTPTANIGQCEDRLREFARTHQQDPLAALRRSRETRANNEERAAEAQERRRAQLREHWRLAA